MRLTVQILLLTLLISSSAVAQSDEMAIEAIIKQVFIGMEKGDSAMAHQSFSKHVTMATVNTDKNGKPELVMESSMAPWLASIAKPRPDKLYEEIWGIKINIDGAFAQVWCDFAFYVGKNFHHCGIDSFQLFKESGTWKIFHIADTRRTTGCDVPVAIQDKHK